MAALFKARDTFIIRGRGLVLAGWVIEGKVRVGMNLRIESFPRQLAVDELGMINTGHKIPGLIGLIFLSTDQEEIDLWKTLEVENKIFELTA